MGIWCIFSVIGSIIYSWITFRSKDDSKPLLPKSSTQVSVIWKIISYLMNVYLIVSRALHLVIQWMINNFMISICSFGCVCFNKSIMPNYFKLMFSPNDITDVNNFWKRNTEILLQTTSWLVKCHDLRLFIYSKFIFC